MLLLGFLPPGLPAPAQTSAPLPDAGTLLHAVEAHQRDLEKTRESYTYLRQTVTEEVAKNGSVKKTTSEDAEIFYVNSHEITHTVRKNGQALSSGDQKKEDERVRKEVEKAETVPPGQALNDDTISVGRMLAIMKTSPPHREVLDGRSTIALHFTGDPQAKTHGRAENASKKVDGTVWVDEQDRQVRRLVAVFDGDFGIGYGLLVLAKGSSFSFDQKPVNSELWLPASAHVHVIGKALGFVGYRAEIQINDSRFQRFHAEADQAH